MTPERFNKLTTVLNRRQSNLTIVMENVQDPHNISAVMRTCDAVGIQDVYILNNKIPRHKKWGAKSSSSAAKWLTVHQFTDVTECLAELRTRYQYIYTTHLAGDAVSVYNIDFTQSVALVFGNEHSGVSEEIRAIADSNFIIPQMGVIKSLNISVACAVTIYEAFRQKNIAGHYNQSSMGAAQRGALMSEWGLYEDDI